MGNAQLRVLEAVAAGQGYGFDIMEATGLASGTVYPALSSLKRSGLLRASWESTAIARREKRPPRRYYQITGAGREALAEALDHHRDLARSLARTVKGTGRA